MEYQSYNVSFDDKTPLLFYLPFRGGNSGYIDIGSDRSCWYISNTTGRESSYTTYLLEASVALQWAGTAIWLYGEANATYTISRSWNIDDVAGEGTELGGGVLYSDNGIEYGLHTLTLVVQQGPVTITGATITVGIGEVGSTLTSTNISALDANASQSSSPINPFFTVSPANAWHEYSVSNENGGQEDLINTYLQGAYVTFTVNSSVGFAVYGANAQAEGAYLAYIDPPVPNSPNASAEYQFNATTASAVPDEIKYLVTGLDRKQSYEVKIVNADSGRDFNLGQVVLFDADPPTPTGSSPSKPTGMAHSDSDRGLHVGAIVGIAVGSVAVLVAVAVSVFLFRRYRSRVDHLVSKGKRPEEIIPRSDEGRQPGSEDFAELHGTLPSPYRKSYMDPELSEIPPDGSKIHPTSTAKSLSGQGPEREGHQPEYAGGISGGPGSRSIAQAPPIPIHEEDAGPMLESLPPMYDPRWSDSRERAGE